MFLKTEERNEEEKDTGQYSPKGSFGELLLDVQNDPDKILYFSQMSQQGVKRK